MSAPFNWIADADSRLGPVLEAIINGRYYWVPIQQIRAINITQAADLRDLVWLPAEFTWINGGQAFGLIPTRYPGSESVVDSAIQIGAYNAVAGIGRWRISRPGPANVNDRPG